MKISEVGKVWIENLKVGGYERKLRRQNEYEDLKTHLPQIWKMILKELNLKDGADIFELGCGGGTQLP